VVDTDLAVILSRVAEGFSGEDDAFALIAKMEDLMDQTNQALDAIKGWAYVADYWQEQAEFYKMEADACHQVVLS